MPKMWTDAEKRANRAATYAEWNLEAEWTEWVNDRANDRDTARAYRDFLANQDAA
jgi:hypothetical protein